MDLKTRTAASGMVTRSRVPIGKLACLLVLCLFLTAPAIFSADQKTAYWLTYEQGNAAIAKKEFGQALQLYKEAVSQAGIFPEAEMAIGDVYLEEGEWELARRQYEKAYNERNAFYVPNSRYDVLYKLASLFESQELYNQMEDDLGLIIADDKSYAETATSRLRTQVEKNYFEKGIDRVLLLYTFEDTFAAAAHSKLGWFYYRTGRFSPSVSHLLYSVLYHVSQIKTYLEESDAEYQFSTLEELLASTQRSKELLDYATAVGLFKDLYYLAGAAYAVGYPQHSLMLWNLLSNIPSAGIYQDLSKKQAKSPWIEPLLFGS